MNDCLSLPCCKGMRRPVLVMSFNWNGRRRMICLPRRISTWDLKRVLSSFTQSLSASIQILQWHKDMSSMKFYQSRLVQSHWKDDCEWDCKRKQDKNKDGQTDWHTNMISILFPSRLKCGCSETIEMLLIKILTVLYLYNNFLDNILLNVNLDSRKATEGILIQGHTYKATNNVPNDLLLLLFRLLWLESTRRILLLVKWMEKLLVSPIALVPKALLRTTTWSNCRKGFMCPSLITHLSSFGPSSKQEWEEAWMSEWVAEGHY